ncbi:Response regulator receiver domain-containing protein [Sphingomonas sp. EC-HK361]|uniref:response regulator n=1 Tax=Sphingomonas sp. EC-HK361 TaxID=2038397 RepID=UPI001256C32D|nr:response regulator [Sphingomonas sp. EC-HK361]VVT07671.1 Response regulator receiver domain-containing protein [Sphingomonas sp. EC-HK361]
MFGKKKRQILRLLVVEDEPLIAFDAEHLLTEQEYVVVATVDRVADAVAVLEGDSEVHLVLVDVSLADGSGLDVARAAQARSIPVLFVTGHAPQEAEALAIGWLSKPYTQRGLLSAIETCEKVRAGKPPRRLPSGFTLFGVAA